MVCQQECSSRVGPEMHFRGGRGALRHQTRTWLAPRERELARRCEAPGGVGAGVCLDAVGGQLPRAAGWRCQCYWEGPGGGCAQEAELHVGGLFGNCQTPEDGSSCS